MGSLQAMEMAEMLDTESAIAWHLQSNHFPPVTKSMVQACIESIDACNEGNFDKLISLPEGVGYKGLTVAPANAIVEQHHLDAWVELDEEFDWYGS
jgi:(2Fe-2S) ferredoxin